MDHMLLPAHRQSGRIFLIQFSRRLRGAETGFDVRNVVADHRRRGLIRRLQKQPLQAHQTPGKTLSLSVIHSRDTMAGPRGSIASGKKETIEFLVETAAVRGLR
jgi:hypothetical protein